MDQTTGLLSLPPEIRTAIYTLLFDSPYPIYLRTPSHRRLKCSRIDKKDPRGILATCHQLRREALPIFFNLNVLQFRNSIDALEFLNDASIHQSISQVISRIAVDDGDASFHISNLWQAQSCILSLLPSLPNLDTIEFRVYARHDNPDLMKTFKDVRGCWNDFSKQCRDPHPAKKRCFFGSVPCEVYSRTIEAILQTGLTVESLCSRARYEVGDKLTIVYLNCNNLIVGKSGKTKTLLGGADQAAPQRMKRVGTIALRDENTLRVLDDC